MLLSLPSKMFYSSELRAKADPMVANCYLGWEHLVREKSPIIFHSVQGKDQREERSPSFFNPHEVEIVVNYLEKLLTANGKYKVI